MKIAFNLLILKLNLNKAMLGCSSKDIKLEPEKHSTMPRT